MAVKVLLNQYVTVNASTLAGAVKSAALAVEAATLDSTAMGDTWIENTLGLKSGTLTLELLDDFTDNAIDELVWTWFNAGTAVAWVTRMEADSIVSVSNPQYSGSLVPNAFNVGGAVGELAMKSLAFPLTGSVTRTTST
jgi:hypothetical protein